jgi:citrate lyase subunit beta/citryl-CoA lyase
MARKSNAPRPHITLFTPGNRRDMIEKSNRYDADAIIVDLEDAVPIQLKAQARDDLAAIVPTLKTPPLVRVNNEPERLDADLEAVVAARCYGVILPMAENVDNVRHAAAVMARAEEKLGIEHGATSLMLQIETALAVMRGYELATASDRIEAIIFASAEDGDMQADLKCAWSPEGTEMLYVRSKVLADGRAAKLPLVLDGAFSDVTNEANLRADCTLSKRLGYDGRTVIHPKHLGPAREIYLPGAEQVAYYERLIATFEKAEKDGLAAVTFEGKMIDYAMYKKAKILLADI